MSVQINLLVHDLIIKYLFFYSVSVLHVSVTLSQCLILLQVIADWLFLKFKSLKSEFKVKVWENTYREEPIRYEMQRSSTCNCCQNENQTCLLFTSKSRKWKSGFAAWDIEDHGLKDFTWASWWNCIINIVFTLHEILASFVWNSPRIMDEMNGNNGPINRWWINCNGKIWNYIGFYTCFVHEIKSVLMFWIQITGFTVCM